jgi:hypothetical protein
MDPFNSETWKHEWTAVTDAPYFMLTAILIVGSILWWFLKKLFEAQIAGLNAEKSALKEQLNLAAKQAEIAGQAEGEFKKQLQTLEAAIANKADYASLAALTAKVDAGFGKLAAANNAVSSTVSVSTVVLRANDAQNIARFAIEN